MANIKDYIEWRGDLNFDDSEFNELDNLIFAGLCYFNIEDLVKEDEEVTFRELLNRVKSSNKKIQYQHKKDEIFFPMVLNSKRFADTKLTKYVKELDPKSSIQFGATTFILPNDKIYVGFRGTSESLVGWKEDFEMSFLEEIPSQKRAIAYLKDVASKYPDKKIYVGGHSKGGNLAIYSSMFADETIQDRIEKIFNNDGPGIQRILASNNGYKKILPKIITYIPQTSIVGRLLIHDEKTKVVYSTQKGIWQHSYYSWQLCGKTFVFEETPDKKSNKIKLELNDFMYKLNDLQRKEFINILFKFLQESGIKTFDDITKRWYMHIGAMLNTYTKLDEMQRKILVKTFEELYLSSQEAKRQLKEIQREQKRKNKFNNTYSLKKDISNKVVEITKLQDLKGRITPQKDKQKVKTNENFIDKGFDSLKKFISNL